MSMISEILEFNREFVARKDYERFRTDRFPDKKAVILTCMDTRLVELLPRAVAGVFACITLAALSCVVALVLAYLVRRVF